MNHVIHRMKVVSAAVLNSKQVCDVKTEQPPTTAKDFFP